MRILWLKTELLHPVDKGGKIRTYQMLRELRKKHHITYLTLNDRTQGDEFAHASEYCHELVCVPHHTHPKFSFPFYAELAANLLSPLPYFMTKYRSLPMRLEIEKRLREGEFDVVVCDFLVPAINMPESIPCATVLFQHNVEAMIWQRHYEVQSNPLKKAYLYGQWQKTRSYERRTCRRFDTVVAVSHEDAENMRRDYGLTSVQDIPTGVDIEYFRPDNSIPVDPCQLVFTGSMDWLPNEDAIGYFTQEVLPRIRQALPDATLTVVGRNPSPALIELAGRDSGIVVTGRVEDVRPFMERAAAFIVPIRIGGGTRLKIYEAMAMAKPVVSTTVGAEGLPLRAGTDLLIEDTPEQFAAAVVRLLKDRDFADRLGREGASRVRAQFGWDKVSEQFAEICARVVKTPGLAAQI